jgi:hypothetical protein
VKAVRPERRSWRRSVRELDGDPLDLIQSNLISCAIIELGGARTFMRGHGLRILKRSAGFKLGGDARGAEGMAADPGARAELGGAALDHAPGVPIPAAAGGNFFC